MISANWNLPFESQDSNTSIPSDNLNSKELIKKITINDKSAFAESINSFMQDLSKYFAMQDISKYISKNQDKLVSIEPFDAEKHSILLNSNSHKQNFDLDDKQQNINNQDKIVLHDKKAIGKTLAKYGVVFPAPESLEIAQDPSDPLVTVFTIRKTYF